MSAFNDADALPHLLTTMRAAGFHDRAQAQASLDDALASLHRGRHKARPDIARAQEAVEQGNWYVCWSMSYQAICGLTHAFPPDLSLCPPPPGTTPLAATTCTGCGAHLSAQVRFCPSCGTRARN